MNDEKKNDFTITFIQGMFSESADFHHDFVKYNMRLYALHPVLRFDIQYDLNPEGADLAHFLLRRMLFVQIPDLKNVIVEICS